MHVIDKETIKSEKREKEMMALTTKQQPNNSKCANKDNIRKLEGLQ